MVARSFGTGGAPRVIYNIATHLMARSAIETVHVCYLRPPGDLASDLEQTGVPTTQVSNSLGVTSAAGVAKAVQAWQPDIVHTHMMAGNAIGRPVARLFDVPVVSTIHTRYDSKSVVARLLDRLTAPLATANVAVSQQVAASLPNVRGGVGFARRSRHVIHNCINVESIRDQAAIPWEKCSWTEELDPDHDRPLIANIARFDPIKRRVDLVRALPTVLDSHPNAVAIMAGKRHGEEYCRVKAVARHLGVSEHIRFTGHLHTPYSVYHHADVAVFASASEGFSIGILEAMAVGVPIVATDIPAFREALGKQGATAASATVGDPKSLAAGINRRLHDSDRTRQLTEHFTRRVRDRFSDDTAATAYLDLYREIID